MGKSPNTPWLAQFGAMRRLGTALSIAVVAYAVQPDSISWHTRIVASWDLATPAYLGLAWALIARADANVTRVCPRVFVHTDDDYDARYPAARMARIQITGIDGRVHERVVDDGYGSPAQPMEDDALARKFEGLVAPVTGMDRARELRAAFAALDAEPDAGGLLRLLAV